MTMQRSDSLHWRDCLCVLRWVSGVLLAVSWMGMPSCLATTQELLTRASFDLSCPADQLQLVSQGPGGPVLRWLRASALSAGYERN
jgi:hypothetical protein